MTTFNLTNTAPPSLYGLTASTMIGGIRLRWFSSRSDENDIWATEIWSSTTDTLASATLISTVIKGNVYIFNTTAANPASTLYFWIRAVNSLGYSNGEYFPKQVAATITSWLVPASSINVDYGLPGAEFTGLGNVTVEDGVFAAGTATAFGIDNLFFYNFATGLVINDNITKIDVEVKGKVDNITGVPGFNVGLGYEGSNFSLTGAYYSSMTGADLTATNTMYTISFLPINIPKAELAMTSNFGVAILNRSVSTRVYSYDYIAIKVYKNGMNGIPGTTSALVQNYHLDTVTSSPGVYSGWASVRATASSTLTEYYGKNYFKAIGQYANTTYVATSVSNANGSGTNGGGAWTTTTTGSSGSNSTTSIAFNIAQKTITGFPSYPQIGGAVGDFAAYEPGVSYGTWYMVGCTNEVGLAIATTAINYSAGIDIDWTTPTMTTGTADIQVKIVIRNITDSVDIKVSTFKLCEWSGATAAVKRAQSVLTWESSENSAIAANKSIRVEVYIQKNRSDTGTSFSMYYNRASLWMDREL